MRVRFSLHGKVSVAEVESAKEVTLCKVRFNLTNGKRIIADVQDSRDITKELLKTGYCDISSRSARYD